MKPSGDASFKALYDHYKDSFEHIRERERRRDRLFLYVIALLGGMFLFGDYPQSVIDVLETLLARGATEAAIILPESVISSALWTVLLVVVLRYFQADTTVDRQ